VPNEVRDLIPILDARAIRGGFYVPSDGDARAWQAAAALAEQAATRGASFFGHTKVLDILTKDGRAAGVQTDRGAIRADTILLCTNIWGPVLSDKVGVTLPLMAVEHQYAITEQLPELAGETRFISHPVLRHQDARMYFRQHADAYGIGSYNHEPLLVDPHTLGLSAVNSFTIAHFDQARLAAEELLPPVGDKRYVTSFNGMFTFTVDGYPILGESAVRGLWAAVGVWVTHAGGAGKAIAEWMTHGYTELDMREANIARFHAHARSRSFILTRAAQQYREVYDVIHPLQQMEEPRCLRLSPFHQRLQAQGAVFFESAGWEVAQWYEANSPLLEQYSENIPLRTGWAARHWSPIQGAEHLAVRERGGLFNLAAFTKIDVRGAGALDYLESMAANRIGQPIGKVVYTSLLTAAAGIKADVTITRTGPESFLVLTGGGTGPQDLAWLRRHAPGDESVTITDMTSAWAGIGLWGPTVRTVLAPIAEGDVSNAAFPYFTARSLVIDNVPAYALRVSYAGELGWEIYCPTEYALRLWDVLWSAGRPHGLIAAGAGAFNSLRLEKGYRAWGADIHTDYNPYEAGLAWATRPDKGDFLGRDALRRAREQGSARRLCCLTLDEPGAVVLGKEPIVSVDPRHSRALGYVTSADTGYSVGKHIAYGYLPATMADKGRKVDILYFGERIPATVSDDPLFDPQMTRLKE
jgi:glycine cleavage system aminomethyltransferase T